MAVKIAINGFGRIGRLVFRALAEQGLLGNEVEVVAVGDLVPADNLAYLLKYDSTQGRFNGEVSSRKSSEDKEDDDILVVNGKDIHVVSARQPSGLPWKDMGVDLVIESTGLFTSADAAQGHIEAGAKKVIISAPAKGDGIATLVMGVNHESYDPANHHIISNASCTTNCLAPLVYVLLKEGFGIDEGLMTTVHAYTGDQQIVDGPHRDPRRARAAAINVVPTSTGAAKAIGQVMPRLRGRLDGSALRAPVAAGSLVDLTVLLKKETDVDSINAAFQSAARSGPLRKVLEYSLDPLVSSDIVGSPMSCTFDAGLTQGSGRFFKVFGWYDNEVGYSHRLVDLVALVGKRPRMRRAS